MTNEKKQLLLIDLCARLPHDVKCNIGNIIVTLEGITKDGEAFADDSYFDAYDMKPYLRPMSSMTDEERTKFRMLGGVMSYSPQHDTWAISAFSPEAYDWLNKNGFDYRGLIPMGLALEALEGMYEVQD